jgi:hypothetical protein
MNIRTDLFFFAKMVLGTDEQMGPGATRFSRLNYDVAIEEVPQPTGFARSSRRGRERYHLADGAGQLLYAPTQVHVRTLQYMHACMAESEAVRTCIDAGIVIVYRYDSRLMCTDLPVDDSARLSTGRSVSHYYRRGFWAITNSLD